MPMSAPDTLTILGIAGSPRRHGNSERLLDECLAGARAAGAEVDKLVVVECDIAPCTGCGGCAPSGVCVISDDMADVYERLDGADAVVVASPVYFATVPAVLKALYDRLQPYWVRRYVHGEQVFLRRPGALLLVRGGGDPFGFEAAAAPTRSVFAVLGIDYAEELHVEGPDAPEDIERFPAELANAARIGRSLVESVRRESQR